MDEFDFEKIANYSYMLEHMEEIARATGVYRRKLQEQGFDPNESFMLTVDWHRTYWQGEHTPPLTIVSEDGEGEEDEQDNED